MGDDEDITGGEYDPQRKKEQVIESPIKYLCFNRLFYGTSNKNTKFDKPFTSLNIYGAYVQVEMAPIPTV